jgi:peptidoglycan/LPS O-acetylase OafA/YrhL
MNSRPYNIRALDGIRGLAIIFVMLHHFEPLIPASGLAVRAVKLVFSFGWMGVDLFFALSGFLISGILLDSRTARNYFSSFYIRRVLRIFPLYYSVLTIILLAGALVHPRPQSLPVVGDQKLYYFYLVNWLGLWKGPWRANFLAHFWSLAVEEQFYLLWPLCVWLLTRRDLMRVALVASTTALVVRITWLAYTGPSQAIVMATVTRMDSLLCGALAAMLFRDVRAINTVRKFLPWAAYSALLCFAICGVWFRVVRGPGGELFFVESLGFTLLAFGFSALVLHAAVTDSEATVAQNLLRSRVLTKFGKYSYGIYVYHIPLLGLFIALQKGRFDSLKGQLWFGILCVVTLFASSFLIALISYEGFERRFLDLKRHFETREVSVSEIDHAELAS